MGSSILVVYKTPVLYKDVVKHVHFLLNDVSREGTQTQILHGIIPLSFRN